MPEKRGLTEAQLAVLLGSPARAVEGAEAAAGRFPLILMGNGLTARGFTFTSLCEYLAGHGYVVVSMPSLGPSEAEEAPFDLRGIELQLGDLVFAADSMREHPSVLPDQLGVVAWSVGGVTAALMQMTERRVGAMVSLDSGTTYAYGNDMLRESDRYDPSSLDRPFLQMIGLQASTFVVPRDNRFFSELQAGPKYQLEFPAMQHGDFTSLPGDLVFTAAGDADKAESFRWVARYTAKFLDAYLRNDRDARAFLQNDPAGNGASPELVNKIRHEPAD